MSDDLWDKYFGFLASFEVSQNSKNEPCRFCDPSSPDYSNNAERDARLRNLPPETIEAVLKGWFCSESPDCQCYMAANFQKSQP